MFSLQCSWINRLLEGAFHEWKVMILHLIKTFLGKKFKSHSDLDVNAFLLKNFTRFYQEILHVGARILVLLLLFLEQLSLNNYGKLMEKVDITNFLNKIFRGK